MLGGLGLLLLVFVLVRGHDDLLGLALGLGGVAYAVSLFGVGGVDEAAPLVATALLLCGELAAWSLDERIRVAVEPRLARARAAALAGLALAGLAAAALVVALAATSVGGGFAWTAVGAAAAVLVLAVAVRLARA